MGCVRPSRKKKVGASPQVTKVVGLWGARDKGADVLPFATRFVLLGAAFGPPAGINRMTAARLLVLYASLISTACGGTTSAPPNDGCSDGSAACRVSTVTFHLSAANGMSSDWCVGLHCTSEWVTVTAALSGKPIPLSQGCTAAAHANRSVAQHCASRRRR